MSKLPKEAVKDYGKGQDILSFLAGISLGDMMNPGVAEKVSEKTDAFLRKSAITKKFTGSTLWGGSRIITRLSQRRRLVPRMVSR